jgi:hypothetical protein
MMLIRVLKPKASSSLGEMSYSVIASYPALATQRKVRVLRVSDHRWFGVPHGSNPSRGSRT